jgi:hypothetical protein
MTRAPSSPLKPLTKGTALTVGSLVLLAGGVVAIVKYLSWEDDKIQKAADAVMKSHVNLPLKRSHPDAFEVFPTKRELNGHLHKIERRIDMMDSENKHNQKLILERLPRTRHWSHISHDLERRRRAASKRTPR